MFMMFGTCASDECMEKNCNFGQLPNAILKFDFTYLILNIVLTV